VSGFSHIFDMHVHTSGLDGFTESKAFAKFSKVFEEINHFFSQNIFFQHAASYQLFFMEGAATHSG